MLRTLLAPTLLLGLLAESAAASGVDFDVTTSLVRPEPAPDADVEGKLRLRDKKPGDQRFEVTVENTDPTLDHLVRIETSPGSGVYENVGLMSWDGFDEVKLKVKTKKGASLPLGKAKVQQLVGHEVVVQVLGQTIVSGTPADSGGKGKTLEGKTLLATAPSSPDPNAKAKVKLRSKPSKGDERFIVKVEKIDPVATTYTVFLESPAGSGTLVAIGELSPSASNPSKGVFKRKTKKGQALPLGASSAVELGGRPIEVRADPGGLVASGTTPGL